MSKNIPIRQLLNIGIFRNKLGLQAGCTTLENAGPSLSNLPTLMHASFAHLHHCFSCVKQLHKALALTKVAGEKEVVTPQNVILTQNVITIAVKCNTNAKCNNIDAKEYISVKRL